MWPLKKKVHQRRLEVRKSMPVARVSPWRRLREAGGIGSLLLALGVYLAVVAMDVLPLDPLGYRVGQYVASDVYARVRTEVGSQRETTDQIREARGSTPATFQFNKPVVDEILAGLQSLPERLGPTTQPAQVDAAVKTAFGLQTEADLEAWRKFASDEGKARLAAELESLRAALSDLPIVLDTALAAQQKRSAVEFIQAREGVVRKRNIGELIALGERERISDKLGRATASLPPEIRDSAKAYLLDTFARNKPLLVYDAKTTDHDIEDRIAAINANPPTDTYEAGALLVRRSIRPEPGGGGVVPLSAGELEVLQAEHAAFLRAEQAERPWRRWTNLVARGVILLMVLLMLCLYIAKYEPRIVRSHLRGLALAVVVLMMLGLNKAIVHFLGNPNAALLAVLVGAIVLVIAYDQRFAMTLGTVLSVLVLLQMRAGLGLLLVLLAGTVTAVFLLHDIRTRTKLMETGALVAAAVCAMIVATESAAGVPLWPFVAIDALWGLGSAVLAGMLIWAFLPAIERAFRVATSLTLLEWCDASKPLLRRLAMEAPGTYNHSLQLGAMCEAAAEAIGARGLLARVGAYYHDIGKINKPQYFIENQGASPSRHAKLSPAMSLLIIIAHVKDGLEMAREYGLPPVLHEFITSHHGTTLVQYFYHAATEQRKADAERAPDEVEFRYPGPKPHSKEAAILMLADAAESSVRSMSEPTPGRIENQVHTMVTRRLMDGQFDDCDLTLSEVHKVEASLVKSLCGVFHARIAYPTPAGLKPSAAELAAARKAQAPQPAPKPADDEPATE